MKARSSKSQGSGKSKRNHVPNGNVAAPAGDRALGMNGRICRRDFLNSTLLASGSVLLESLTPLQLLAQQPDWGGYTGVGDYAGANGNTEEVMLAAHAVRDGVFGEFKYQEWGGPPPPMPLSRTSYHFARDLPSPPNFGFYFGEKFGQRPGKWVVDPWKNLDHQARGARSAVHPSRGL